jgi:hypothetical protein
VVLAFRETAHGWKVIYDDGHLVEFAVFTRDELRLASINDHRLLFDRGDVAKRIDEVVGATERATRTRRDDDRLSFGMLVSGLLVGLARHRRGEAANIRGEATHVQPGQAASHFSASATLSNRRTFTPRFTATVSAKRAFCGSPVAWT